MKLDGKRVLVTGGTRGIGRATVEAFLAAGARVAVNGSTPESTERVLVEIGTGAGAVSAPGDVGEVAGCEAVVGAAVEALGGLDVLVNNAGVTADIQPIEELDADNWDRGMNVNVRGAVFCIKYAAAALRESGGCVVNISSILGIRGRGTGSLIYCASKGAIVNATRDLAMELAPQVRVNCVCPGAVDTDMLRGLGEKLGDGDVEAGYRILAQNAPLQRVADASELANTVLYLASDLASFVTGEIIVVDGGRTVGV